MLNAYFYSILLSFVVKLTWNCVNISHFWSGSGIFIPEIESKSRKLLAVGCRFPPKGANFGTLLTAVRQVILPQIRIALHWNWNMSFMAFICWFIVQVLFCQLEDMVVLKPKPKPKLWLFALAQPVCENGKTPLPYMIPWAQFWSEQLNTTATCKV